MTLFLLLLAAPVRACEPVAVPWENIARDAKMAFVGTIARADNGRATFTVEKGFRGAADGTEYDTDIIRSTCGLGFAPGQRWLFLGNDASSGSLMLMNEYGRRFAENEAAARKTFGDFPADGSAVRHGTATNTCAPWDGAALAVALDNGLSASVYVSPAELAKKIENGPAAYQANGQSRPGHAAIVQCPLPRDGEAENLPCRALQGEVGINSVSGTKITGYIETRDGEHHARHIFRVKRENKKMFCG